MHNLLEAYLKRTEHYLKALPPHLRESELNEIASHLELLHADLCLQGHNEDEAANLATARFGSARKVGLRLRDVWEGNRGWLVTLSVVFGSNWALQVATGAVAMRYLLMPPFSDGRLFDALAPLVWVWAFFQVNALPFIMNFALGRWGGRRVVLAALLTYIPWLLIAIAFWNINPRLSSPWVGVLTMAIAMAGAWMGSSLARRRRMALVSGVSLEEAGALLKRPRSLRERLTPMLACLLALGLMGAATWAWTKPRVQAALHPPTPEAAVRNLLSNPGMNLFEMHDSTDVVVRVLPPKTARERQLVDRERRVAYSATMHATEEYRQRRIAYYEKLLKAAQQGHDLNYPIRDIRASLERLGPGGYQVSGVLRVKKTAEGWEVDTSGGPENQPWSWLYDISFEEPK